MAITNMASILFFVLLDKLLKIVDMTLNNMMAIMAVMATLVVMDITND